MKILVAILAGGEGRRIGGNKPLRMLAGETLLARAIAQARQWSDLVIVAVRQHGPSGAATRIFDEPGIDGPLGGLAAALRFADSGAYEAVLTIAADMPFLPPDLGQCLTDALGTKRAAIASSGGQLHPVCGLWRASGLAELPGYLTSGKRSLRGFAEAIGYQSVEWPAKPVDPFFNVNSEQDLVEADRLLRLRNRAP